MPSGAVQLPLLQMRQQASSEDREVLLGQTLKQQSRESLGCGDNIERPRGGITRDDAARAGLSQDETGDTGDAAVIGASACLE